MASVQIYLETNDMIANLTGQPPASGRLAESEARQRRAKD